VAEGNSELFLIKLLFEFLEFLLKRIDESLFKTFNFVVDLYFFDLDT
jgi:hypothetical protein